MTLYLPAEIVEDHGPRVLVTVAGVAEHVMADRDAIVNLPDGASLLGDRDGYTDQGGASRFFYTPKADRHERPRVDGVSHPTVKPLDLMAYLIRLVTPRGGTVLDPFAGSGTTGEAAAMEGCKAILIEREPDYLPLIMHRINRPVEVTLP